MNFLSFQSYLKLIVRNFKSCSLVSGSGALLYSKDINPQLLTTTRLVAFQIVKKYLNPKPHDFFILNDPENGGYQYSKLIFISCLTTNLFLIWNEDSALIDFKIPPTPLFEQGIKNNFIWQALVNTNKFVAKLEFFLNQQKEIIERIMQLKDQLILISSAKNQQLWLNASQEIFSIQFTNKAQGSTEAYFQFSKSHAIKLKFVAEERQSQKLITLDFTNTNLATDMHTSSHVIESALIEKIIRYYQINDFFTQAVLDKIKIILPPRSIVSKPHPTGKYNFELQSICSQLCDYNLKQLNSHMRKSLAIFEYTNFLNFEIYTDHYHVSSVMNSQIVLMNNFEKLIDNNSIRMKKMKRIENISQIVFQVNADSEIKVSINNNYSIAGSPSCFKLNNELLPRGKYNLKKDDLVEIIWG